MASSGSVLYFSLTAFGESVVRYHGSVPNIFSAIPTINGISPCNVAFPRPDLLYSIWVSLSVFDSGKLLALLPNPSLIHPNVSHHDHDPCQGSAST